MTHNPYHMAICKLCNSQKADQKGAHIFSDFLIREAIYEEGVTKRNNKEIMFSFSPSSSIDFFIGRSVTPDKIEEVLGRPMSDEEIERNHNSLVVDDMFCRQCEQRFTIIESYFKRHVYDPIRDGSFQISSKDSKGNLIINYSIEETLLIKLFFIVQIWRAAASNLNGFKLYKKQQEKLRVLINQVLIEDIAMVEVLCNKNREYFFNIPMIMKLSKVFFEL